jgi:acyl-CoA synthetase (AMP-forming)/AMP-acid ligase II
MNFCRIIGALALRYKDNPAIVNVERNRRYTFAEYHRLTNRIANMCHDRLGLGQGDTAMLMLDNDNFSLVHFPAIFKQEAAFVFGNLRDGPEESMRQIDYVNAKAAFIETRMLDAHYDLLSARGCAIVAMDREPGLPNDVLCFWDLVETASDADNDVEIDVREHIAVLRFTSGTTGPGKCAMYVPDQLFACRDSFYIDPDFGFDETTRYLALAPLSHASIMPFVATFFTGGATYTLNAPDLAAWCKTVQEERITHALLVPTLLYRLIEMNSTEVYDLSSLRTLVYGAAPIAPAAVERLIEQFGQIFVQLYGSSEVPMCVSVLDKRGHDTGIEAARRRLGSAGRITPGVELIIADDDGRPLPIGTTGEIWVRSRATISGYYRNPEGTAAEFTDGFWKSGDLGYVDEGGYLFIVDRKKDMIITGGFNVYAVEVEAALSEHPAVMMSTVVGVPHRDWGEAVHAEVILRQHATVSADQLIDHVKARLGSYKAPKTIAFVQELPLSPVGKVLRRQVKERYWKGQERRV